MKDNHIYVIERIGSPVHRCVGDVRMSEDSEELEGGVIKSDGKGY